MVTVEDATTEHAAEVCRVCTASWRDAYADVLSDEYVDANVRMRYDPERVTDQIAESEDAEVGKWLVALDDDTAGADAVGESGETDGRTESAATVVGTVRDERLEPRTGEVSDLYVHPGRQREGIGSRLFDALTERQRAGGATEQVVYVFAEHDDAIGFYESKGFEADERLAAATVDGMDPDCEAVRLSRPL
jgi:GNAT superfamily N-acetyltransferase